MDLTVEKVVSNEVLKPILVSWDHGKMAPNASLKCDVLKRQDETIVCADRNGKMYVSEPNQLSNLSTNYLIVVNKNKTKVRMYDIESSFMSQFILHDDKPSSSEGKDLTDYDSEAAILARKKLTKAFASKRVNRKLNASEKMYATESADSKVQEVLNYTADSANTLEIPALPETVSTKFQLPKCDKNADSIENAYKLEDLFTSEELNSVKELAEIVARTDMKDLEVQGYSQFFLNMLRSMPVKNCVNIQLLLLCDALLDFIKMLPRNVKNDVLYPHSAVINKKLIEEFCVNSTQGRLKPPSMMDKALCYIILLLFRIFNYTLSLNNLINNMQIFVVRRIYVLIRALGAREDKQDKSTFILKLPLADFTEIPHSRARKGRK